MIVLHKSYISQAKRIKDITQEQFWFWWDLRVDLIDWRMAQWPQVVRKKQ